MRQRILKKLIADTKNTSIYRMAKRLEINYISLWRIVNGKSPGNIRSWDKIFAYYGRNYKYEDHSCISKKNKSNAY